MYHVSRLNSLGSVALDVKDVGPAVGTRHLEAGDDAEGARGDLGDHVGEDDGVSETVAQGDVTDIVSTDVLEEYLKDEA